MVMTVDPLLQALRVLSDPGRVLLFSPQGRRFDQPLARELAAEQSLTLICGRYEGIDARFQELYAAEAVSVGDFVLSGGESAALCLVEAVSRLLPEFMGCAQSSQDSFASGLLEHPQYTRPAVYQGLEVPQVLLSGDHKRIAAWRRKQALQTTLQKRPELLQQASLEPEDQEYLCSLSRIHLGRALYLALVHYPVWNKNRQVTAVSLTNLDIHDIARICCTYGLGGYYLVTPLQDQQGLAKKLISHWIQGSGSRRNPDRLQAMQKVQVVKDIAQARAEIVDRTGQEPLLVGTSARQQGGINYLQLHKELGHRPVLILFGTGYGLASEVLQQCDVLLPPIRFMGNYNHLSVRSAAAIIVDRILGDVF